MVNSSLDSSSLSPLKRALLALKDMRARVDELERSTKEPIAIIGIGCRLLRCRSVALRVRPANHISQQRLLCRGGKLPCELTPIHAHVSDLRGRVVKGSLERPKSVLRHEAFQRLSCRSSIYVALRGGANVRPRSPVDAQARQAARAPVMRQCVQKCVGRAVIALPG